MSVLVTLEMPVKPEMFPTGTALVGGAVRDALLDRLGTCPDLDLVLPANVLKLTRRLAAELGGTCVVLDEERDMARLVLKGWTIDLARQLGIRVVVEGVETFDELAALGCQPDLVLQGFLVSRPVSRGHVPGFDSFSAEQRQAIADQVNGGSGDLLRDRA